MSLYCKWSCLSIAVPIEYWTEPLQANQQLTWKSSYSSKQAKLCCLSKWYWNSQYINSNGCNIIQFLYYVTSIKVFMYLPLYYVNIYNLGKCIVIYFCLHRKHVLCHIYIFWHLYLQGLMKTVTKLEGLNQIDGLIVVFSCSNSESFNCCLDLLDYFKFDCKATLNTPLLVIGNKTDLNHLR